MVSLRNAAFAEERAEVEVLFAEAKKFEEISKKMKASLARLQTSGGILGDALALEYSNTAPLHVINNNVDKMLAVIDQWQKPLEGRGQEESIIRDGPAKAGVTAYLTSLKRVDNMLSELASKKLRVNQQAVDELGQLVRQGNTELQSLFDSILREDGQKIEPLHYITKQLPFPTILQNKISDLASINSFMSTNSRSGPQNSPTTREYAEIRGNYLHTSLQNLAFASISTSKKKSLDEVYRQGTSGIGTYASGLEGMFVAEWQNIVSIFSPDDAGIAFEMTTRKAMAEFSKTVQNLNSQIKSSIITDCFLAFEVVDVVTRLAFRMDGQTGQTGHVKQQLIDAIRPVRDTAKLSLSELLEDIRRRIASIAVFQHDGAAVPLTSEVMTRCQSLLAYPQVLSSFLSKSHNKSSSASNGSSSSLPTIKSLDISADGNQLIAHYVLETFEILLSSLETRARTIFKTKAILGVFMANNVAVIDRMIRSSDLQQLLSSTNSPNKIEIWRKKGTGAYLDSWREPCAALMDVQYTNRGTRPPSGNTGTVDSTAVIKGLSSKDKDAIKEKFKTFNSRFEELSAKHKELGQGMERDVKNQLAREIQAMIEPLYARFWDRYHEIDKGKGKYVKFDKGSLASQLSSLG